MNADGRSLSDTVGLIGIASVKPTVQKGAMRGVGSGMLVGVMGPLARTLGVSFTALIVPFMASSQEAAEETKSAAQKILEERGVEPVVVEYENYRDPLEPLNRAIFAFNDGFNRYIFVPVGNAYMATVPKPARKSIGNVFYTIKAPIYFVNNLLQGKGKRAGENLARLGINLTIGIGGLFDPAADWFDIQKQNTYFHNTLDVWGAGYGIYLVIPFIGSSDIKDLSSLFVDRFFDPVSIWVDNPEGIYVQIFDTLQKSAPLGDAYIQLHKEAEDPYIFFRNLHLQGVQRDAEYPKTE